MKTHASTAAALTLALTVALALTSCRGEEPVLPSTKIQVTPGETPAGDITGFYLLNEGNMGSNKATLDRFDYATGIYTRNLYAERNPGVVKELGDVGNDLQIYGDRLYAVINGSNLIEVMDAETARHIAAIPIPNCRYIAFHGGFAYVSSYAGEIGIDPNARRGYVAKIDIATMRIVAECSVGYQPDGVAVVDDKLYVANSGGYRVPDYDRTVSVIDLVGTDGREPFTVAKTIDVGINLHRIVPDNYGNIYVSSRGDHLGVGSRTYIIDTATDEVTGEIDLPCDNMAFANGLLYVLGGEFSGVAGASYTVFDTAAREVVSTRDLNMKKPYGIAVNSDNGDVFITEAGDYVTPGTLWCFRDGGDGGDGGSDGAPSWSATTGDIPAHIAFTKK